MCTYDTFTHEKNGLLTTKYTIYYELTVKERAYVCIALLSNDEGNGFRYVLNSNRNVNGFFVFINRNANNMVGFRRKRVFNVFSIIASEKFRRTQSNQMAVDNAVIKRLKNIRIHVSYVEYEYA